MKHKVGTAFNLIHNRINLAREPYIILVTQEDNIARAGIKSVFKVFYNTLAGAFNIADSFIFCNKFFDYPKGFTFGAVIGNNELVIFTELVQDGLNLLGNILLAFICGKRN